jgi:hypothetical protein
MLAAPGTPFAFSSPQRGEAERRQALGAEAPHPVARLAVGPISGSPEITGQ